MNLARLLAAPKPLFKLGAVRFWAFTPELSRLDLLHQRTTIFIAESSRKSSLPRKSGRPSGTEDLEKRGFECERFLNIAAKVISQFFQMLDSPQHFRRGEAFRKRGGLLPCRNQIAPGDFARRSQNIRPKLNKNLNQARGRRM